MVSVAGIGHRQYRRTRLLHLYDRRCRVRTGGNLQNTFIAAFPSPCAIIAFSGNSPGGVESGGHAKVRISIGHSEIFRYILNDNAYGLLVDHSHTNNLLCRCSKVRCSFCSHPDCKALCSGILICSCQHAAIKGNTCGGIEQLIG